MHRVVHRLSRATKWAATLLRPRFRPALRPRTARRFRSGRGGAYRRRRRPLLNLRRRRFGRLGRGRRPSGCRPRVPVAAARAQHTHFGLETVHLISESLVRILRHRLTQLVRACLVHLQRLDLALELLQLGRDARSLLGRHALRLVSHMAARGLFQVVAQRGELSLSTLIELLDKSRTLLLVQETLLAERHAGLLLRRRDRLPLQRRRV